MATVDTSNLPDIVTDPNVVLKDAATWLHGGAPNYDKVNTLYEKEKQNTHAAGSLAELVTNLIKNWEKEASHKVACSEWRTVDPAKFGMSVNGGPFAGGEAIIQLGTYNALIGDTEYYAASKLSCAASHDLFRNALGNGFAFECLQVYSGPPRVVFKWRHWGRVTAELRCPTNRVESEGQAQEFVVPAAAIGKTVELFGIAVVDIDEQWRIGKFEVYFDPNDIFKRMMQLGGTRGDGAAQN